MLLQTSEAVAAFCESLRDAPFVTIDTEFMSEQRYRPDLCLVQIGAPGRAAAIDPQVPGIDLRPLAALLANPAVLKVLHAGSQDIGIFVHRFGVVPTPLFDTQVMASVCGFGDMAGYATLCKEVLGVAIDKTAQATDWSLRPLTPAQITYALGDVTHLQDLYHALQAKLDALGRGAWVTEELAALADPAAYTPRPERAWRGIRVRRPTPRTLALVVALAAWREEVAAARNKPRGWLVHDEALVEIAEQLPTTPDELARVRRLSAQTANGADGRAMLKVVARVLAQDPAAWPVPEDSVTLTAPQRALVLTLQALLELRCAEHAVGARLVASSGDLQALVLGQTDGLALLRGWRADVFGRDALALCAGELVITGGGTGAVVRRA